MTGYESKKKAAQDKLAQPAQEQKCWCTTCRPITMSDMRFVVCPDCGNKRCPKANDHCNACTGSNEVGQKGSSWEHVKPLAQPAQEPVAFIEAKADNECADAYADGWNACVRAHKDTTPPQPEQEPVAWIQKDMQCDDFDPDSVTCEKPARAADGWEWIPLYTTPPQRKTLTDEYQSGYYDGKKAALAGLEQNFCPRCGKRTKDIHTCTPPQENT